LSALRLAISQIPLEVEGVSFDIIITSVGGFVTTLDDLLSSVAKGFNISPDFLKILILLALLQVLVMRIASLLSRLMNDRLYAKDSEQSPEEEREENIGRVRNGEAQQPSDSTQIPDLNGMTAEEADALIRAKYPNVRGSVSPAGNRTYKFPDGSRLTIKSNGEVVRTPRTHLDHRGHGIKGIRIDANGGIWSPHQPGMPSETVNLYDTSNRM
jgi:hypothetical protein